MARIPFLPTVVAVALLAVSVSGCMGGSKSFTVDGPAIEPGFTYEYESNAKAKVVLRFNGAAQPSEFESGPVRVTTEYLSTAHAAGAEPVYLGITSVDVPNDRRETYSQVSHTGVPGVNLPPLEPALFAQRQSDLAAVGVDFLPNSCANGCMDYGRLAFGSVSELSPFKFPLTRGKTWTDSMSFEMGGAEEMVGGGGAEVIVHAKASKIQTLDTALGKLEVVRVDYEASLPALEQMREQITFFIQASGGKVGKAEFKFADRSSAYYSPELHAIVRAENRFEMLIDLQANGPDGTPFDIYQSVEATAESKIIRADLTPKADRGQPFMVRLLDGALPVGDATTANWSMPSYGLNVSAAQTLFNAADAAAGRFTANVTGSSSLPEGHTLHWKLLSRMGDTLQNSSGPEFSHTFKKGGPFDVALSGRDEYGVVQAAAKRPVMAYFERTWSVTCPDVALAPTIAGCASQTAPVEARPLRVLVEAKPIKALAAVPNDDVLEVRDAAGGVSSASTLTGTVYRILKEGIGQTQATGSPWAIQLVQKRAVMEDVEFHVLVEYEDYAFEPPSLTDPPYANQPKPSSPRALPGLPAQSLSPLPPLRLPVLAA